MKKVLFISVIILYVFSWSSIFAKDYKDAEPVIKEMAVSLETFINGLEKADTASKIAAVINSYAADMTRIAPVFKKLMKKYPELNDEDTHPEALKPYIQKMENMTQKLIKLYSKITEHMNDTAVSEAFEKLNKASAMMDPKEEKEGEEE